MKPVRKVVFPVNGLGTRFLPATKAMPKEMLPVVDKPLIQYAVEEAAAAGVTEMIFVTGRNKRAIEDHFDTYAELERELEMKGKQELLEIVREIVPPGVRCIYIRQPQPLGLGHAAALIAALTASCLGARCVSAKRANGFVCVIDCSAVIAYDFIFHGNAHTLAYAFAPFWQFQVGEGLRFPSIITENWLSRNCYSPFFTNLLQLPVF